MISSKHQNIYYSHQNWLNCNICKFALKYKLRYMTSFQCTFLSFCWNSYNTGRDIHIIFLLLKMKLTDPRSLVVWYDSLYRCVETSCGGESGAYPGLWPETNKSHTLSERQSKTLHVFTLSMKLRFIIFMCKYVHEVYSTEY